MCSCVSHFLGLLRMKAGGADDSQHDARLAVWAPPRPSFPGTKENRAVGFLHETQIYMFIHCCMTESLTWSEIFFSLRLIAVSHQTFRFQPGNIFCSVILSIFTLKRVMNTKITIAPRLTTRGQQCSLSSSLFLMLCGHQTLRRVFK